MPPDFRTALRFWWKLGWISFDGPTVMAIEKLKLGVLPLLGICAALGLGYSFLQETACPVPQRSSLSTPTVAASITHALPPSHAEVVADPMHCRCSHIRRGFGFIPLEAGGWENHRDAQFAFGENRGGIL